MTAAATAYRARSIVTRDGVRLACREYGRPDAEHTVIPLHGFCLNQSTWAPQIRGLLSQWGQHIRIVSFDYRGHGKSDSAPIHTYTIGQLAHDLADVIEALHIEGRLILAGHSMGGMTVLAYLALPATARRANPHGVVLAATAAGNLTQHGVGRLLATPGLGALAGLIEHLPHRGAEDTMRALARPACHALTHITGLSGGERAAFSRAAADALARTTAAAAIGFLPSLRSYDQTATLSQITADTTIISGGKDLITPVAHAAELAAGIAGSIHLHQPAAGHMLLHEAAAAVTDAISSTIARAAALAPVAR